MPTDLQASTSSTSSMCKQNSLDDSSFGLDKSRDESSLSKELYYTHLTNGSTSSFGCCTPIGISCLCKDDANDRGNEKCKVVCTNSSCDQSGWIHVNCMKLWEQKIKTEIMKLSPQVRNCMERQTSVGGWLDLMHNVLPSLYQCRCLRGSLTYRVDHGSGFGLGVGITTPTTEHHQSQHHYYNNTVNSNTTASGRRKNNTGGGGSAASNVNNSTTGSMTGNMISGSGFSIGSNSSRKSSLEMTPSSGFNSFNKRLRSRTLSANVGGCLGDPHQLPFILHDFPNAGSKKEQQISKMNGIVKGNKTIQNLQGGNSGSQQHRQRHHSSCYHGSKDDRGASPPVPNSAGNIFKQRSDFKSFQKLPFSKQNAYFIQMEDDSCTGNDDTKVYLLTLLSQQGCSQVNCLICGSVLPVYDHLPLIDGTFFLSPLCHSHSRTITVPSCLPGPPGTLVNGGGSGSMSQQQQQVNGSIDKYLHALCVHCMHEIVICCQTCHRPWTGAQLLVGSLYTYDVFAAVPCCASRLACNNCNQMCVLPGNSTSITNGGGGGGGGSAGATGGSNNSVNGSSGGVGGVGSCATNNSGDSGGNSNNASNRGSTATINNSNVGCSHTNIVNGNSQTPSLTSLLSNFSQLSRSIECVHCHSRDYHFVKPFEKIYKSIGSIS